MCHCFISGMLTCFISGMLICFISGMLTCYIYCMLTCFISGMLTSSSRYWFLLWWSKREPKSVENSLCLTVSPVHWAVKVLHWTILRILKFSFLKNWIICIIYSQTASDFREVFNFISWKWEREIRMSWALILVNLFTRTSTVKT